MEYNYKRRYPKQLNNTRGVLRRGESNEEGKRRAHAPVAVPDPGPPDGPMPLARCPDHGRDDARWVHGTVLGGPFRISTSPVVTPS